MASQVKRLYNPLQIVFAVLIAVALLLVYYFKDPGSSGFFPSCPFHALTGLYCAGCGSQRAFYALLHLSFLSAMRYNVLFVLGLPIVTCHLCAVVTNNIYSKPILKPFICSASFVKSAFVLVIVFSVLRNVPVYPFTLLSP